MVMTSFTTRICIQPNEMVEHALKKAHLFSFGGRGGIMFSIESYLYPMLVAQSSPPSHLNSWKSKVELQVTKSFQLLQHLCSLMLANTSNIFSIPCKSKVHMQIGISFSSSSQAQMPNYLLCEFFHKCLRESPSMLSM